MAIDQQKDVSRLSEALNVPNGLSIVRALIGIPVIYLLQDGSANSLIAALVLMALAEISDGLDGIIARRSKIVTSFGKVIDPMADSLYRALVFLGFLSVGWMSVWFVAIIFGRDIIVSYVRILSQQMGVTMAARNSGKFKAFVQAVAQFATVGLYLAAMNGFALPAEKISFWLLAAATLFTAYSCVDYTRGLLEVIHSSKSED